MGPFRYRIRLLPEISIKCCKTSRWWQSSIQSSQSPLCSFQIRCCWIPIAYFIVTVIRCWVIIALAAASQSCRSIKATCAASCCCIIFCSWVFFDWEHNMCTYGCYLRFAQDEKECLVIFKSKPLPELVTVYLFGTRKGLICCFSPKLRVTESGSWLEQQTSE